MRTIKKDNIHKTLPAPKHRHTRNTKHDKETVRDSHMAIKDRLQKPENSIKCIAHLRHFLCRNPIKELLYFIRIYFCYFCAKTYVAYVVGTQ